MYSETIKPSLRPYRPALVFSFTNAFTWMIVLGTPMVLLGEMLGASAFAIGLAYSAMFLALPVQILATSTIPRFGYKLQMSACWAGRSLAVIALFVISYLARRSGIQAWMTPAFVVCAWYFCILLAAGNSATAPWMYEFIPSAVRGRYFATDQTISSLSGIMVLLTVCVLFVVVDPLIAFMLCFVISFVGSVSSTVALFFWPSCKAPPRTSLRAVLGKVPALCTRASPYRHYLALGTLWWLLISPIIPFSAYYLKTEVGLGQSIIILYSAIQFVGTLLGALWVSQHLDDWGVRPFFAFTLVCYALVGIYWVLLVIGVPMMLEFAALSFFLIGLCNAFWFAPNLKYLPQVCPKDEQPLSLALFMAMTGVAAGISPIIGGFFVRHVDGSAGMEKAPFLVYLCILIVSQFLLLIPFSKLEETEHVNSLPGYMSLNVRPNRYLSHVLSFAGRAILRDEAGKVVKRKQRH